MIAHLGLSALLFVASAASDAQFVVYGGNHLGPSYYYQLQLTNGTVILELRGADVRASRASLDATITEVKQRAPKQQSWTDVTEYDGSLMDAKGVLIGRLNCQFKDWTCEQDQAMVMELAAGAEVVDRTYVGNLNARFQITQDDLDPRKTYGFTLRVMDSLLLTSSSYATVAEAKADITAIQAGQYTWKSVSVPVGPVSHMNMEVLADSSGRTLAQVNTEYGLSLTDEKAYIEKYAPTARVDEPTSAVLV